MKWITPAWMVAAASLTACGGDVCDTAPAALFTGPVEPSDAPTAELKAATVALSESSVTVTYTDANGNDWVVEYSVEGRVPFE